MVGHPVLKELEQLWRLFQKTWQRNRGSVLLLASLLMSVSVMWSTASSVSLPILLQTLFKLTTADPTQTPLPTVLLTQL